MLRLRKKEAFSRRRSLQIRRSLRGAHPARSIVPVQIMEVIHAVENNDPAKLDRAMIRVIQNSTGLGLSKSFLMDIKRGLDSGDWSRFAAGFKRNKFVGKKGRFLLVAPYTTSRGGKRETRLSAIYGVCLALEKIPSANAVLQNLFGEVREHVPELIPFHAYVGAGWFAGEAGEAFIVPNGWAGLPDGDGPVLNNMSEQLVRVGRSAMEAIRKVFDLPSATLLLSVYRPQSRLMNTLNREYSFHEAGHAAGIGLNRKMAAGVFNSPFFGAVEEWRADGVAFEAAQMLLPAETAGTLVASNMITRFGIDAHRKGALDLDTDVNSALLTFQSLIESGTIRIYEDNRLGFVDPSFMGLVRATQLMRASTLALTRKEMQLSDPHGIWTLYPNTVTVPESIRHLFRQTVVVPCIGLYRELR